MGPAQGESPRVPEASALLPDPCREWPRVVHVPELECFRDGEAVVLGRRRSVRVGHVFACVAFGLGLVCVAFALGALEGVKAGLVAAGVAAPVAGVVAAACLFGHVASRRTKPPVLRLADGRLELPRMRAEAPAEEIVALEWVPVVLRAGEDEAVAQLVIRTRGGGRILAATCTRWFGAAVPQEIRRFGEGAGLPIRVIDERDPPRPITAIFPDGGIP
jgi:hypothetical protein